MIFLLCTAIIIIGLPSYLIRWLGFWGFGMSLLIVFCLGIVGWLVADSLPDVRSGLTVNNDDGNIRYILREAAIGLDNPIENLFSFKLQITDRTNGFFVVTKRTFFGIPTSRAVLPIAHDDILDGSSSVSDVNYLLSFFELFVIFVVIPLSFVYFHQHRSLRRAKQKSVASFEHIDKSPHLA